MNNSLSLDVWKVNSAVSPTEKNWEHSAVPRGQWVNFTYVTGDHCLKDWMSGHRSSDVQKGQNTFFFFLLPRVLKKTLHETCHRQKFSSGGRPNVSLDISLISFVFSDF